MTMIKGPLGLSVRERASAVAGSLNFSAKALPAWVAALPLTNIGETARMVYQALGDLNRLDLPETERVRVLATLNQPVQFLITALRKHYIGQSISLNEKQRKIAALSQALRTEMAIGYKTVIENMLGKGDQKFDRRQLLGALHKALEHLSAMLLHGYLLYSPQPAGLWHELHLIYHFAEQNQLHDQRVTEGSQTSTVATLYKKALLLAAANPYQLRQLDCERLYTALQGWADHCRMPPVGDENNQFVVNLGMDSPPIYQALAKQKLDQNWRSLDLSELLALLEEELRTSANEGALSHTTVSPALLRHLVRAWGNMTTRAFSRTACSGEIRVSIGLGATHFLLRGEDELPREQPSRPSSGSRFDDLAGSLSNATLVDDRGQFIAPRAHVSSQDIAERIYQMPASHHRMDVLPNSYTNDHQRPAYEFQKAALFNISPGGYCLEFSQSMPSQTQTGEVIGLLESEGEDLHWNIGTIRWLRRTAGGPLQAGVQLLAPNARPVMTQVRNSKTEASSYQRSLLLPALKGIGQPATLITQTMPYQLNQKVRIQDGEEEFDARLTKLVAVTAGYKQFHFEPLSASPRDGTAERPGDDDFDSVWTLL